MPITTSHDFHLHYHGGGFTGSFGGNTFQPINLCAGDTISYTLTVNWNDGSATFENKDESITTVPKLVEDHELKEENELLADLVESMAQELEHQKQINKELIGLIP